MKEQIIAVQKMQNYIEKNINENISLTDLSRASLFSPWYSHRLFKEYTNYTPADYIRRLKLSKSALRLRDEECKIIDIAFELGFQSVEGYQRAFSREFGCNPSEYAKKPIPIRLFIPSISGEPVCMWLPEKYIAPETSKYVQGVEVSIDSQIKIPDGFEIIQLPKSDYIMFQGEPFLEKDYCQAIEEVQDAVKKYNPESMGYQVDTDNPKIQLEPIGKRGYIEMVAVKPINRETKLFKS